MSKFDNITEAGTRNDRVAQPLALKTVQVI